MRNTVYLFLVALVLLCSCSETKYVAEGEYLLDKVKVRSDGPIEGATALEMKQYVRQTGNSRWFSAAKLPLMTYSLSGRDTTKWINRLLRSVGEPPVLYDTLQTEISRRALETQLQNMGHLRAWVDVTNARRGRKLTTTYWLHPGASYHIRNVEYMVHDTTIQQLLHLDNPDNWRLTKGMTLSTANLDNERKRITQMLNNLGYYRFNKEFITYRADSVRGSTDVDLALVLNRYRNSQVADTTHSRYTIRNVRFLSGNAEDSIIPLRRKVLLNNTFIHEGEYYSAENLQRTYNHFGRLGAVKFTGIDFREIPDSALLDCDIRMTTNKPSTISFQPEGTNTAGDLGAAVLLTYQNRNIFHGSESFSIELRGAFEAIRGLEGYSNSNFQEYSLQTKLSFPRFIAPFIPAAVHERVNATSEVALSYDLQDRPEYLRRVFTVGWRYKWNNPEHNDRYQVDVLDLNFIAMPWISETFQKEFIDDAAHRNSLLLVNFNDLFIMRTGFRYSYNNRNFAVKTNVETGGNLLYLLANTFRFDKNEEGEYMFLNVPFAQYAKVDIDFTRYFHFDYRNQLVLHAGLGIAYPYGNTDALPFEKSYFSGGANSVRGWSVRSLGPGSYSSEDGRTNYVMHTGDLKLDLNMEYRAHLFWKLGGALFVDAGNIWSLREYEYQPEGKFYFSKFLDQLAVSYGLGFRLNFDYFILRFDMGMKAVNPVYSNSTEHFPIVHPKLSRDFAFHFAVGLPF